MCIVFVLCHVLVLRLYCVSCEIAVLDRLVTVASANTALPHRWVGKCWLRDLGVKVTFVVVLVCTCCPSWPWMREIYMVLFRETH